MAETSDPHRPALSILIKVRGTLPNLRPAEQRVAELVLADPAGVSESSITTVARRCQTSETTVLRFCRAIGLGGYPDLRIALARAALAEESEQTSGQPTTGQIDPEDSLADVVAKITRADERAIADTAAVLDLAVLERAVDAVATAPRVDIYGVAASGLVGADLHHKLHRIGKISYVWTDPHLALTSAAVLQSGDVAVAISHTGTTVDTVDTLRVAQQRGATTIAITNFAGSPISEYADLLLLTAARETTFRSGAMSSRIAQLALVDCLFAGVAQRSYDQAIKALESTYAVVRSRHGE
ncbi:putative RpiR family transcriptional regulator [Microlunatus phosphovorus NM-1]|uniref:Putative RpiR family transcriptional regulator n=1 Tax=Microlunatus phosphovorus (strain ATCC 700054 / DSM 10555 / JCM 9379 / NBRC 101784 / NCIMB 13414 / VKM Ac-1990 / NM-1) TaxID=1032480 RepID=F5XRK3_MICPN|nr:MurR/RpiR family transcriptional regulator [Microlunatus phosphovorus]BAK34693.1 putative RpiR family transcriptional regulator [Microlunatus phosphovorus NM-1]